MKVINPIALARQALVSSAAEREEEARVLHLFRDRAELKKAYTGLQDEIHRLKDRLKQQEGATEDVQEQLQDLESRLGVPETAYPTMVFYQLRNLWTTGSVLLRAFGHDLQKQQLERERREFLAEKNRVQFEHQRKIGTLLRAAETEAAEAAQQVQRLGRELRELNRPWHHFKRRAMEARVVASESLRTVAEARLERVRGEFDAAMNDHGPTFPGLSLAARRATNLAMVAYAEILCLRIAGTPLLALARAATERRDPAEDYGGRAGCESLILEIARARALLMQRGDLSAELRSRSARLQKSAVFRASDDAVPVPDSPARREMEDDVLARRDRDTPTPQIPDILSEDIWDISRNLLR